MTTSDEQGQMIPEAAVEAADPLMVPTNEYAMRDAANLLSNFARAQPGLSEGDIEVLNYAYRQLHRGANTLRADPLRPTPHVENELLAKDPTAVGDVIPGTFAGRIAARAYSAIQHGRPTP